MAGVIDTSEFRKGMKIEVDGEPFEIVEFQHVKPGKGSAFVRTSIRSLPARRDAIPSLSGSPPPARICCSLSSPGQVVTRC